MNSLTRDAKTFTKFTNEQKKMMYENSNVIEKQKKLQNLTIECVKKYDSIRKTIRR